MSTTLAIPTPTTLEQAQHHHAQNHLLDAAKAYRETLLTDPQNHHALLGLSFLAHQSTQPQPALHMAQAALAAAQSPAESALAHTQIGDCLFTLNQTREAQSAFEQALKLHPELAAAHYGLGNIHAHQENYAAAVVSFTHAIQHAPHSPEARFALAFTLTKLAQHPHAIALYQQALQLRPTFAAAWLNLGVTLIAHGQPHLADHCYQQALTVEPANIQTQISAHLNQGHLHRSRQHYPQAQTHYEAALQLASTLLNSRLSEVHIAFTYLHLDQHQLPQAWHSLRQAESSDPHHQNPEVPNAKGILLLAEDQSENEQEQIRVHHISNLRCGSEQNRVPHPRRALVFPARVGYRTPQQSLTEQAIQSFHQAESRGHTTAPSNRGNALLRLGRLHEALAAHEAAVARDPHHPGTRYNLALTQLRLGDYTRGWPNYEIRWQFRELHPTPRLYPQPRWQGDPVPTLFLYSEQGLGDTLQFLRYLPKVIERLQTKVGAPGPASGTWDSPKSHLILEVQPPLLRLLQPHLQHLESQFPNLTTQLVPHGAQIPPFTHHIPLLSLPALFQTTIETIPNSNLEAACYLHSINSANSASPAARIGLSWAGNPNYRADHERSTTLHTFQPLLEIPNIHWLSLQKGPATSQIAEYPQLTNASEHDRDLADTAAIIQTLDLVITTDTAVAHLTGALGKPLWLLLPWQSDWRWMQDIPTTPWYPTARLFRQPTPNNWPALIQQVATELQQHNEAR